MLRRIDRRGMAEGTQLVLWGFFKKLYVADNAAVLVNRVFDHPYPSAGREGVAHHGDLPYTPTSPRAAHG